MSFVLASLALGLLFAVMDAAINANPYARRLSSVYDPVAKTEINVPAGIAIDLAYGVLIAGTFVLLAPALPGAGGLAKGLSLGLGMWLYRVVMSVATTFMTHRVPGALLAYQLAAGLAEMLVLGVVAGLMLG